MFFYFSQQNKKIHSKKIGFFIQKADETHVRWLRFLTFNYVFCCCFGFFNSLLLELINLNNKNKTENENNNKKKITNLSLYILLL